MPVYAIEPQRDTLKDEPDDDTWFVACEDDEAELFAVIDIVEEEIVHDATTRADAEAWIEANCPPATRLPEPGDIASATLGGSTLRAGWLIWRGDRRARPGRVILSGSLTSSLFLNLSMRGSRA